MYTAVANSLTQALVIDKDLGITLEVSGLCELHRKLRLAGRNHFG
jgi:hypothetical protein